MVDSAVVNKKLAAGQRVLVTEYGGRKVVR